MPKLLYIEASPRTARSHSRRIGQALVDRLASADPSLTVDRLDLWAAPLPELDGVRLDAKYATLAGQPRTLEEDAAWDEIAAMVRRLDAADVVVVATPMWNFGLPYRLKHYIDLVTQPGLSFTFDPKTGYAPLLRPRPVYVVLSSAGDYRFGPSRGRPDLATPYLTAALGFIGLAEPVFVPVGPTVGAPEDIGAGAARAERQLAELAATP